YALSSGYKNSIFTFIFSQVIFIHLNRKKFQDNSYPIFKIYSFNSREASSTTSRSEGRTEFMGGNGSPVLSAIILALGGRASSKRSTRPCAWRGSSSSREVLNFTICPFFITS